MSLSEKTPKKVDEAMVDRIIEEAQQQRSLKEQIYDRTNVPIWCLDILIAGLIVAFGAVIYFGR